MNSVGIAIIGFGTIGTGVVEILQENRELIRKRIGTDIELKYVIDKDTTTSRRVKLQGVTITNDYKVALNDPDVQIVIELVGGVSFAYQIVEDTLKAGKNSVTANKALLAEKGAPLFELALNQNCVIGFEASIAGGIPIIRTLTNALVGDNVTAIYGIVNGTTNYILTKMFEENMDFDTALKQAQELGFAEADPTLDIEGGDAAHKIALLGALAFNNDLTFNQVYAEGISRINLEDIRIAGKLGYIIKLLGIAKIDEDNQIELRVNPTLVPTDYQLASVRNEFNAIMVESKFLGRSMYYGRGAGSQPTATAVVADIISIARSIDKPTRTSKYTQFNHFPVKPMGDIKSRYYIRFNVKDQVGVLSKISGIFGKNNISIATVLQFERSETVLVPLILTTHSAYEKDIIKSLDEIENADYTKNRGIMLRILD